MRTFAQTWKRSIATLALLTTFSAEHGNSQEAGTAAAPSAPAAAPAQPQATELSRADQSATPNTETVSAATLVQDARLLQEIGKLDEAETKLHQALKIAPDNKKARRALSLLQQLRTEKSLRDRFGAGAAAQPAASEAIPGVPEAAGPAPQEHQRIVAPPQAQQDGTAASRYRMDPQLAARYGLLPKRPLGESTESGADEIAPALGVEGPATATVGHMDPRLAARYGLIVRQTNGVPSAPTPVSRGKQQIEAKLNQIVMGEATYDNLPLSEVIRDLSEQARKRDPEKRGINFLISNVPENSVPSGAIDPTTGQPIPAVAPATDLGSVPVKLRLRDVRLKDVLDAMTRISEQPIRYSVEDYGVVFSPGPGTPGLASRQSSPSADLPRLMVRTFRVDTNTFLPGLETAFGIPLKREQAKAAGSQAEDEARARVKMMEQRIEASRDALAKQAGDSPKDDSARLLSDLQAAKSQLQAIKTTEHANSGLSSRDIQQALRQLLQELGVNMEVPGKAVFYNDLTGIIMVRATADDLDLVQAAIETLGGKALRPGANAKLQDLGTSRTVSVLGKVNREGALELPSDQRIDVLEAIARASGLQSTANKNKIELNRAGKTSVFRYEDLVRKTADQGVWLEPGDVIYVPESLL